MKADNLNRSLAIGNSFRSHSKTINEKRDSLELINTSSKDIPLEQ